MNITINTPSVKPSLMYSDHCNFTALLIMKPLEFQSLLSAEK
ncbi:hypothetical protein BANRA_05635 [Klebsiella pneumoniae]|nr:hypothetical protein BANRA_05635 [Klebsiella pneumoniae]